MHRDTDQVQFRMREKLFPVPNIIPIVSGQVVSSSSISEIAKEEAV